MSKKFKSLYEFTISKKEKGENVVINDDGSITVTTVDIEKPFKFCLRRPGLNDYDEAELFFAATVGEGIQAGLITESLLSKRFKNDDGVLSEAQRDEKEKIVKEYAELKTEQKVLTDKKTTDLTEEEKNRLEVIKKQIDEKYKLIVDYIVFENSTLNITAEARARNKTVVWWMLRLLNKDEAGKWEEVFFSDEPESRGHKERLNSYSELEDLEGDEKLFMNSVVGKALLATSYWFSNGSVSEAELKEIEQQ